MKKFIEAAKLTREDSGDKYFRRKMVKFLLRYDSRPAMLDHLFISLNAR